MLLSESWLRDKIIQACDEYTKGKLITERVDAVADAYAAAIVKRVREDRGTIVSCDTTECLYNDNGECIQDDIHLNAYQMCESVDTG